MGWIVGVLLLGLISWLGWSLVEFDAQILDMRMVKRRRRRGRRRKHHH